MAVIYRGEFTSGRRSFTAEDLVLRAAELIPSLRSRARETEETRCLPDATLNDLRRAGLARLLQPVRYGGAEAPLSAIVDLLIPVGAGCGATAWCLAQYLMHNFMIARWPAAAQDEIWQGQPDCLVSGILIPLRGRAVATRGGYRLSGEWPFVSGVIRSDWCILSAVADNPAQDLHLIVRTADVEIVDTWHSIGLRGSASNDVRVQDLFVPEHMTLPIGWLKGGRTPGQDVNPADIYGIPVYMTFGILLASAILGMAEFMFEDYLAQSEKRTALMSGSEVGSYPTHHLKVGEASSSLQAAQALLRADCEEIMELAATRKPFSAVQRSNYRCNAAFAGQLAFGAARIIWDLIGARGVYSANAVARAFQDISVASRHVTQNWDVNATEHGRTRFRLPLTNPSL